MKTTVLIYSGGLDSTVLLFQLRKEGHTVHTLSINYGQRHVRELQAAAEISRELGVPHEVADLRAITPLLAGNSLTSPEMAVPDGHYQEASMKATVVPNRNMLLLAVATARAISLRADQVAYGAHSGDHAVYPDCRPEFAAAMARAIGLADWHPVELLRPLVDLTKEQIVRQGAALGVPFAKTWSCYKGGEWHCGRCGTCIERREAFHLAGLTDPTRYDARAPSVAELVAHNWTLVA